MMRAFLNKPNLKVTVPQQNSAEETFASIEAPPSPSHQSEPESAQSTSLTNASATEMQDFVVTNEIFTGYISDLEEDEDSDEVQNSLADRKDSDYDLELSEASFRVQEPPDRKRHRHQIPVRVAKKKQKVERHEEWEKALTAIEKLIASKKDVFEAGRNSLQAYRARAIQSHLHMVLRNGRKQIDASERAAESQGFAAKWGGRLVRRWVKRWVTMRELPVSSRGLHGKAFSLLYDPAIRAELRSYVRSNKWSMDPTKLSEFVQGKSIPAAAEKYVHHLVDEEMPRGLKKYLELELFPRVQYKKVGKGISLQTARNFLRKEGFRYTEHKKSLYYDGHERPDVVQYRQEIFLPAMDQHRRRLVEFVVGDVEKELQKTPDNYVETRLVLVPHDEMTVQQNDGRKQSWVLNSEHALKNKGVGRGIHLSGIICATKGYIEEAGQTLEYGKNYEGYWTGELFVKQVSAFIIAEINSLNPS